MMQRGSECFFSIRALQAGVAVLIEDPWTMGARGSRWESEQGGWAVPFLGVAGLSNSSL